MENYYNLLKKNGLRKEYNFVKNCHNFLPIIGGKIPKLSAPINSVHASYRNDFFTYHSIPNKSGIQGGGGITAEFVPFGDRPPSMSREQINGALSAFGEFIVDKLKIDPGQKGYYHQEKKETPEEGLNKRLSGNYTAKYAETITPVLGSNLTLTIDKDLSYKPKNNIIFITTDCKFIGNVIDYSVNTGKILINVRYLEGKGGSDWDIDLFGFNGPLAYQQSIKYDVDITAKLNLKTKELIKKNTVGRKDSLGKDIESNIDILDKVLDGVRPTIADLIQHKIKFLPIEEPQSPGENIEDYNNIWEVLSRSGNFGGNRYTGKMLAKKVAEELVKDFPDYEEYILETTYKSLNINIILTLEKIFNFKIIIISKFDAKEDKIHIYKEPKEIKKAESRNGIGNRETTDEFVEKHIRTTVLTGVKNNYTDNLMNYKLIYYNPKLVKIDHNVPKYNNLKQFDYNTSNLKINAKNEEKNNKLLNLNPYLPYQMISIREGMMMCQNFFESDTKPSFYVFLGYIKDDIFQLISIDNQTQIQHNSLPYDIKKFIIDSCGIYKNTKLDYLT
jgi:hypothetical protein